MLLLINFTEALLQGVLGFDFNDIKNSEAPIVRASFGNSTAVDISGEVSVGTEVENT